MKLVLTTGVAVCILALWAARRIRRAKWRNPPSSEVKHEVTIGGKDTKNPIAYSRMPQKKAPSIFSIIARYATGSMARTPACRLQPRWIPCGRPIYKRCAGLRRWSVEVDH